MQTEVCIPETRPLSRLVVTQMVEAALLTYGIEYLDLKVEQVWKISADVAVQRDVFNGAIEAAFDGDFDYLTKQTTTRLTTNTIKA